MCMIKVNAIEQLYYHGSRPRVNVITMQSCMFQRKLHWVNLGAGDSLSSLLHLMYGLVACMVSECQCPAGGPMSLIMLLSWCVYWSVWADFKSSNIHMNVKMQHIALDNYWCDHFGLAFQAPKVLKRGGGFSCEHEIICVARCCSG